MAAFSAGFVWGNGGHGAPQADFDVIVVGAGPRRLRGRRGRLRHGPRACLVTIHLETIAQMSCNPAIGGLAKGHLVREIDALGGLMGLLADETGIQFRLLNRSRGGAVQAPRAQCDKSALSAGHEALARENPEPDGLPGHRLRVLVKGGKARRGQDAGRDGISTGRAVIVTPGTFLNGLIHIGLSSYPAGRANEPAVRRSLARA